MAVDTRSPRRGRRDGAAATAATRTAKRADATRSRSTKSGPRRSCSTALRAARDGDFGVRLPAAEERGRGRRGERRSTSSAERREGLTNELGRVSRVIGREGRMTERAQSAAREGILGRVRSSAVNSMIDDLVRPTTEVARVIDAVADGDLSQKMSLKIEGQPVKGEFLRIGTTVNAMVDQLSLVRRRGHARRARGRHRGQARRPGDGQGRLAASGRT